MEQIKTWFSKLRQKSKVFGEGAGSPSSGDQLTTKEEAPLADEQNQPINPITSHPEWNTAFAEFKQLLENRDNMIKELTARLDSVQQQQQQPVNPNQPQRPTFNMDNFVNTFKSNPYEGLRYTFQTNLGYDPFERMQQMENVIRQLYQHVNEQNVKTTLKEFYDANKDFSARNPVASQALSQFMQNNRLPYTPDTLTAGWEYVKKVVPGAISQSQQQQEQGSGNNNIIPFNQSQVNQVPQFREMINNRSPQANQNPNLVPAQQAPSPSPSAVPNSPGIEDSGDGLEAYINKFNEFSITDQRSMLAELTQTPKQRG